VRRVLPGVVVVVVAVALAAAASYFARASVTPVPHAEQQRIVASFGRTWLPGFLPPGYIFSTWKTEPGSASMYGDRLIVDFGNHGDLLGWVVSDPSDPDGYAHDACSSHPFEATIYAVGARRIVYQSGNHGTTSTLCLRPLLAITVWDGHSHSAETLARFAASARPVG